MTKPPQVNSVYANLPTSRPKLTELTFFKDRIPHGVELCIDTGQVSYPLTSSAFVHQQTRCCQGCIQRDGWGTLGLSGAPPVNGHPHSILHLSLAVVGTHVGILDASMAASRLTVTWCPTSKTLLVNFRAKQFSQRST